MSVARAQEEISSYEFAEWQAYAELEPFGETRADMRAGTIAATIANTQRTKKHQKVWQWDDLIPQPEKRIREPQTMEQQLQIVEGLNAAFGGLDLRGNKNSPIA